MLPSWLGRMDSNHRMAGSKPAALPLGDAPFAPNGRGLCHCCDCPRLQRRLVEAPRHERAPARRDLRAARALKERTGCTLGCDIRVDKRIPLGGGLGGGSSDAATTLVALNRLWQLGLGEEQLAEVGVGLGADVPVFVRGAAAWAEGIGEQLTPVLPREDWYLVVTPPCAADTKEMYADPQLSRATPRVHWADFVAGKTRNDFEPVARRRHPEVARALDWAARYGRARLSGSGASVFVAFDARAAAESIRTQVPAGWRSFVARGLNQSPLKARAVA